MAAESEFGDILIKLFKSRGPRPRPPSAEGLDGGSTEPLNAPTSAIEKKPRKTKEVAEVQGGDMTYYSLEEHERPLDFDDATWETLQQRRKQKIEKELEYARLGRLVAEMTVHKDKLATQSEHATKQLKDVLNKKLDFDNCRLPMQLNAELLVKIEQGMVEVNESPVVNDLGECAMMNRYLITFVYILYFLGVFSLHLLYNMYIC